MKNSRLFASVFGSSLVVLFFPARAIDIVKDNNANNLNLTTSWVGGVAPGSSDVAVWNNTVTTANTTLLGANTSWQGMRIDNPTGLVTINNGNTLTLGSAGIIVGSSNVGLSVRTAVTLGANQSFEIGNGTALQDLVFDSTTSGLAFNMSGFSVSTSGAGTSRFTSGYTVSNGTFNLNNANSEFQSGASRSMTLNNNVTLNLSTGKTLTFGINSAPGSGLAVSSAASITIDGGTLQINSSGASGTNRMEQTGKVSFSGSSSVNNAAQFGYFSNFSGEIALAGTTTWTSSGSSTANTIISGPLTGNGTLNYRGTSATHRTDLTGNNSGFTGRINLDGSSGNRNLRLTTTTAGSASATWSISTGNVLQIDGVSANLGTLSGAGSITNSHVANPASISVGSGSFSGVISNGNLSNGMALTKTGTGTLSFTGANTYSGLTSLQGGILSVTTAQTGAGEFLVSDSATLSVTQVNGSISFNASTLTMGSAGGSTLELTPASSSNAAVVSVGNFNVNGTTTLRVKGIPVVGTTLISYTTLGGTSGFAGLTASMPFRINGTLSDTGSAIVIESLQDETPKWRVGDGLWDINTSANWKTSFTSTTTNYFEGGAGATDSVIFDDTASSTSPITVTLNTTVTPVAMTVNGATDYSISGSGTIAGTTGIAKSGSSALTLATANTFSGGVQVTEGILNVNHASALGSGTLSISDGIVINNTSGASITASPNVASVWNGSFTFTGFHNLSLGGAVSLTASPTATINAGTLTVGGITGSGYGLTKEGSGTLVIGAGSYSGSTSVNAGTLRAGAVAAFNSTAAIALADVTGVNLDLNGFNQTINNLSGGGITGGNVLLGGGTLTTSSSGTIGALSGSGGLIKNGANTFSIAGSTSEYTGVTTINAGFVDVGTLSGSFGSTLNINNSGAILQANGLINGSVGTGNQIVCSNGGFAARGGDLTLNFYGDARLINLNAGGNVFGNSFVFGSPTADSKVIVMNDIGINNNGGTRSFTVNAGTGTDSTEIRGAITPGSAGGISGLLKFGNGTLILSKANTYSGTTTINGGRIVIGHAQALQFTGVNTDSAGKLTATGFAAPTFGGLTGAGNLATLIDIGYSDITTLTLHPQGVQSRTYTGVIADGAIGMNLVKSGTGTQALRGENTYTGHTTVLAGTLSLGNGTLNTSLADPSTISVAAGATLELNFPSSNTDTVDKLFIGGVQQAAGVWGSIGSGAPNTHASLTGTGTLTITSGPPGFAGWITGNFANGTLAATDQDPADDPDQDGISNLVEYAIEGLDPTVVNGSLGASTGTTVTFTKRQPLATDLIYSIETSSDLGDSIPWTEAPTGQSYVNNPSTISYQLPVTSSKNFMRLKVVKNP